MDYDLPPIHSAASRGDLEEVLRLIHQDPQVVNIKYLGDPPLNYACESGQLSLMGALVDHGANIDHQGRYFGYTALYWACCDGRLPLVELLLEKGANPTLPTSSGVTPLTTASQHGRVGVVARLLQYPLVLSTINHRDHNGWTALYYACMKGHPDIVKMLLEAGADPTIRSNNRTTAMDITTEEGNQECVSLLKEWDRSYTITKAKLLHDAFCHYQQGSASSSDGGDQASDTSNKRPRMEGAIPTYLKGRMEGGQPLPKVEMVDGYEEGSLVESVLEYVICGGLKGELFVESMEMLGKTGCREEGEEE